MPRSSVGFNNRFRSSRQSIRYAEDEELTNEESEDDHSIDRRQELLRIERNIKSKKKLHRQRSSSPSNDIAIVIDDADSSGVKVDEPSRKEKKSSDSEFEDSIQEDCKPKITSKGPKKADSTFNSWHDLEVPDKKVELPKSYFTDGPTPWSNFQDLVLGQRFLNTRLSLLPDRQPRFNQGSNINQVAWTDSQIKIVTDLIKEANALMDMFDQVAM